MEKDEKLAILATSFRKQQHPPTSSSANVSTLEELDPFAPAAGTYPITNRTPLMSPTIASLGSSTHLTFPHHIGNPFTPTINTLDSLSLDHHSTSGFAAAGSQSYRYAGDLLRSSDSSSSGSSSSPSVRSLHQDEEVSPTKSYVSIAATATANNAARKSMKAAFTSPLTHTLQRPSNPPKTSFVPPTIPFSTYATSSSSNADTSSSSYSTLPRGALPRNSRSIPIGKDYLDQLSKDIECGMANGLCIMTHPNVPFETSLSQFLPLVSEVADDLLEDLKESSTSTLFPKKSFSNGPIVTSSDMRTALSFNVSTPRFGAVCRNERSRVHYYLHVYDPLVPVHKLFERLMLHPMTCKLESISRIYPVTAASHPEIDFAQTCIQLISSHPLTLKVSNAATSSSGVISPIAPVSKASASTGGLSTTPPNNNAISSSSSSSSGKVSHKLTIGLALESHRASDFAKELSSAIVSSLPFIEIVERNPMHCDLMLSACYFNSVFLATLWEPINTNDLNNYRPLEMNTWSVLHPQYSHRTPFTSPYGASSSSSSSTSLGYGGGEEGIHSPESSMTFRSASTGLIRSSHSSGHGGTLSSSIPTSGGGISNQQQQQSSNNKMPLLNTSLDSTFLLNTAIDHSTLKRARSITASAAIPSSPENAKSKKKRRH
jgi:hypothetical protein